MENITIGVIGFPHAGKSTIINTLLGNHIAEVDTEEITIYNVKNYPNGFPWKQKNSSEYVVGPGITIVGA